MIEVVLVEPEHAGNIGAIARVMKNFGFTKLILVNPHADHLDQEARNRAKHAQDILKKAKIVDFDYFGKLELVIGTTSKLGSAYNLPRVPMSPKELASSINTTKKVGLVFGREGFGLLNTEIEACDFIVSIPTSKSYPALNLSQSVAIMLYELSQVKDTIGSHIEPATKKDRTLILSVVNDIVKEWNVIERKKETQRKAWRRIVSKSFLTHREAYSLLGFLQRMKRK